MNVIVGSKSDVGQVREANEDSFLVHDPLFVVADGMGGHLAGDVASSTAVQVISGQASTASADDLETLAEIVRSANKAIWEKATADPSLRGMGTTCTLMMLDDTRAHFAHVGDSRAYLMRDGQLTQITEDHSLVGRMVKEGKLQPEEAEHHPQRSIITRALGVDASVEVDLMTVELRAGDRILLCSDGLSSMISGDDIAGALRDDPDPESAADHLVQLANQAGGEDNITVVVLDVTDEKQPRPAATRSPTVSAERPAPRKGKTSRKLALGLLVLLVLVVGGYFAGRAYLNSQWFVGVNGDDVVTIYQGIPGEVFGLDLADQVEPSDPQLTLSDLPDRLRDDIRAGVTVDSRADAEAQIETYQKEADEFKELKAPTPNTSPTPDADQNGKSSDSKKKNN